MKVRNPVKMSTEVEKLEASLTSIFLEEGLSIENPLAKKMIHDFVMEMLEEREFLRKTRESGSWPWKS